jgi:hypothetical protein
MGRDLSSLFISSSYQFLLQKSGSEVQDGLGNTITGSLEITASQADTATSASFATSASQAVSSSFATTASFALNAGATVSTASLLTTASSTNDTITYTKGDGTTFTNVINNVSASISASFALTASYAENAITPTLNQVLTAGATSSIQPLLNNGFRADSTTFNSSGIGNPTGGNDFTITAGTANNAKLSLIGTAALAKIDIENYDISLSGSTSVSGSLTVTNGITGSLLGTASFATSSSTAVSSSFATTASFALNVTPLDTGSLLVTASSTNDTITYTKGDGSTFTNVINNVSASISASFATTALSASFAPASDPFPYTGSAIITGSLTVTGSNNTNFNPILSWARQNAGERGILTTNTNGAAVYGNRVNGLLYLGINQSGQQDLIVLGANAAIGFYGLAGGATTQYTFNNSDAGAIFKRPLIVSSSLTVTGSLAVQQAFTASGIIYPNTDGTSGQVITTDGSGSLTFTTLPSSFPFSGSAEITGSLTVTGSFSTPIIQITQSNGTASFGYTGSIAVMDCSKGNNFELVLTSPSASLLDATNIKEGQTITLKVFQSSSTFIDPPSTNLQLPPDIFILPSGSGRYLAPTTLGQIDQLNFIAYSTSSLQTTFNTDFITQSLVTTGIPTANLTVWYKPENFVTSSGRITDWSDDSGLSNDAFQANASLRPYLSGSALNGYDAAHFKGNTETNFLEYTNPIWDAGTGSNATTCFAVVRPTTATANNYGSIISQGGAASTSVSVCPQAFPDDEIKWATNNYAAGGRKLVGNSATGSFYYVTWQWSDWTTRSTTSIRVNGVAQSSADWGNAPSAVATGSLQIGNFKDQNPGSTIDADVCEIIVYRASLSTGDRDQVESYLSTKYGL